MNSSSLGIDKFENKGMELNDCGRSESGNASENESESESGSGNVTFFISIEAGWDYEDDGMGRRNEVRNERPLFFSVCLFFPSRGFSFLSY